MCQAVTACLLLASCAGVTGFANADLDVTGDANGGQIRDGLKDAQSQARAMDLVRSYCQKYSKRGFVTRMDYDTNIVAFECRAQRSSS